MSVSGSPGSKSRSDNASRFTHYASHRSVLLAAALLIGILAAVPFLSSPGFLNTRGGGDSPFLLQRVQQLVAALSSGHFPVRWMPDANYGFGYPFYNYYAPLSIYIAAAFRLTGFSFIWSIQLAQLLGFLVGAGGMFLLGRRWLGNKWSALLASAAYTLAPFHMVNIYVRGDSLAEFWAMAFYPWVLLAADNLVGAVRDDAYVPSGRSSKPVSAALVLGLAYGVLLLTHNISALIFTPFLLLFFVFAFWPVKKEVLSGKTIVKVSAWATGALFLGLVLSAWFWLPALAESDLVQLEPVTEGYFHFSNHFRGLDLLQKSILFDYDEAGGRAFRMGLIQAVAAMTGLVILLAALFRQGKTETSTAELNQDAENLSLIHI